MSKRLRVEFDGFDKVIAKLNALDGDVKSITEKALRESHKVVTHYAEESVSPSNLPAGGKYSTGATRNSLKRNAEIEWVGDTASVPVGFDISKGGLPSIFMIWGTPRYMKNQAMYNAFYGKKIQNEVRELQQDIFFNAIRRLE